jgi:hypothetical protein
MIIDADTHISPTGEDAMAITFDELLRRMDHAGVDKALAWLRPPSRSEWPLRTPGKEHLESCPRGQRLFLPGMR